MRPSSQTTVGVLGAGTMGHGIAAVALAAGYRVVLCDVSAAAVGQGAARVTEVLAQAVARQKLTPQAQAAALAQLTTATELTALAPCALIVEAAPEQLALKQALFARLSAAAPGAVLATNTSALSVSAIASAAAHPDRVVGLHFFNPVQAMKLLEVVRAEQTSDETLAAAQAFGAALGKELVLVKDSPGFASSRLGLALGLEAIRMLEQGVASAEDLDRAMRFGYGHPLGPLELTDLVGLDVRLAVAQRLFEGTGQVSFRPPALLERLVAEGKLGKKSGEGFYKYPRG